MTNQIRPLITLACIVGNEEMVIERFIRSFAPAVDFFCFTIATGNTQPDRTGEIISRVCDEIGVPFARSEYRNAAPFPHVDDFSAARNVSWNEAVKTGADYLMWADADDLLAEGSPDEIRKAAYSGSHDLFIIPYHVRGDSQIVMRERLVKNEGFSFWRYPIHEQLAFSRDTTYQSLKEAKFIHAPLPGKTGSSDRNLNILKKSIESAGRDYYYIQVEYFERREFLECIKYCKAALNAPDLDTLGRYETLLNLAQCVDKEECKKLASEAFSIMPDRREALALLVNYAIIDGESDRSYHLSRLMMGIAKPNKTYWSLNHDWYGWKGTQLHLQVLRLCGKQKEIADLENKMNEGKPMFSIIHATLGRPEKALGIREMWLSRARNPNAVEYIFGLHHTDTKSIGILKGFQHNITEKIGAAPNYDEAAGLARGKIIIQAQDDCYPPQDWDVTILELIVNPDEPVFVAAGDGQRKDTLCVNVIQTAAYQRIKATRKEGEGNGFFYPGYTTVYPDTEATYRAYKDSQSGLCRLVEARDFVIYHDHPLFNPAIPWDETYQFENQPENYRKGLEVFQQRNPDSKTDGILNFANGMKI